MTSKIKIFLTILIITASIVVLNSCSKSSEGSSSSAAVSSTIMDEEIGMEATCPVLGNIFNITAITPVVEYKGKRYYFCCSGCDDKFIEDPEKYTGENSKQDVEKSTKETTDNEEILYWTCSMHPEVKADKEGNCPICGMNLIPVKKSHKNENKNNNSYLHLKERDIALAGVKMVLAEKKSLFREIHTVGVVAYDPTLVTAQEEYLNALQLTEDLSPEDNIALERAKNVLDRTEYKLRLLGMSSLEIKTLKEKREVQTSFIIPEKENWIYADIYENEIGWIKKDQPAIVKPAAYPDLELEGKIKSINPVINMNTRSAQVRILLSHKDERLLPGMYVDVKIKAAYFTPGENKKEAVAVPKNAVINTGNRKVVWVYIGEGDFEPREVKTGPLAVGDNDMYKENYYPIINGIEENEMVVTNGNFLIDSESQITGIAAIGYGGAIGVEEQGHMGH